MAYREILKYPNRKLRIKSVPIEDFGDVLLPLINDLYDTLNVAGGVGLSAPQIGIHKRMIYIACDDFNGFMVNPIIVDSECLEGVTEGCLSFPGVSDRVARYNKISVMYQDMDGEKINVDLSGLAAQVVQHEIEHLNGKLLIDHFSKLKRDRMAKKVKKVRSEVKAMLEPTEEKPARRVRRNAGLSQKEIKKRKLRKKLNRKGR